MTRLKFLSLCFVLLVAVVPSTAGANPPLRWFQPIMRLPRPVIATFRCVIHHESTSTFTHPNLGDNTSSGSSGIFQIEDDTWTSWASKVGLRMHIWQATPYEQAEGAAEIERHDGFEPWSADTSCFPDGQWWRVGT